MKKLKLSCNDVAQKNIKESQRKANDSAARKETIQLELLDFSMNSIDLTMMSKDIKRHIKITVNLRSKEHLKVHEIIQTFFNKKMVEGK